MDMQQTPHQQPQQQQQQQQQQQAYASQRSQGKQLTSIVLFF